MFLSRSSSLLSCSFPLLYANRSPTNLEVPPSWVKFNDVIRALYFVPDTFILGCEGFPSWERLSFKGGRDLTDDTQKSKHANPGLPRLLSSVVPLGSLGYRI